MQYLDHDLEDFICQLPVGKQRDQAIQRMAIAMVDIIEMMHKKTNHIHRDIKPPNFRVHEGKLFITDFGLATEWLKDGKHIDQTKNEPIQGTLRYASHWTHEGVTQSRRDDIEMIGYSIIKLLSENPKEELWPNVILEDGISVNEMSVRFYTAKTNFIQKNIPRFRQAI